MIDLGVCSASTCLSDTAVVELVGASFLCWALGYFVGERIKWVRRIYEIA